MFKLGPISSDGGDDYVWLFVDLSNLLGSATLVSLHGVVGSSVIAISGAAILTTDTTDGSITISAYQGVKFKCQPNTDIHGWYPITIEYTDSSDNRQTAKGYVLIQKAIT